MPTRSLFQGNPFRPPRHLPVLLGAVFLLMNVDAAFGCTIKAPAYRAAMMSDLRNLVLAQAAYASEHDDRFAPHLDSLGGANYRSSSGVAVGLELTPTGWKGRAAHISTDNTCTIEVVAGSSGELDAEPECAFTGWESFRFTAAERWTLLAIACGLLGLGVALIATGRGGAGPTVIILMGTALCVTTVFPQGVGCYGDVSMAISASLGTGLVLGVPILLSSALARIRKRATKTT